MLRNICILFAAFMLGVGSSLAETVSDQFEFRGFKDLSRLTLNGSAKLHAKDPTRGAALRLTKTIRQGGSAFMRRRISIDANASFSTYFRFRISVPQGIIDGPDKVQGADGIVFVVQTQSDKVGGTGGGIGFSNIRNSVGVEFDTWHNAHDPDGNHVGINLNGNVASKVTRSHKTPFNNGKIWHAWIDYNGASKSIEVRIAPNNMRPGKAFLKTKVDLLKVLGKSQVFVGFTSATGDAANYHDILAWRFRGQFSPFGAPDGDIRVVALGSAKLSPAQIGLVLDASGSMRSKIKGGTRKIIVAKRVMRSIVRSLPKGLHVGLRVYGHRLPARPKSRSCTDTELVVPFGPIDRARLIAAIDAIKPRGQTPIGLSLARLGDDFKGRKGFKLVILISDGIETCAPRARDRYYPLAVVRRIQASGVKFRVNVVGFNVGQSKTRAFLKAIAKSSGGRFFGADDAAALEKAVRAALRVGFVVRNAAGRTVARGRVGGTPVTVPTGRYTLVVQASPAITVGNIVVAQNRETRITLRAGGSGITAHRKVVARGAP